MWHDPKKRNKLDKLKRDLRKEGKRCITKKVCSHCFGLCSRAGCEREWLPSEQVLYGKKAFCELCDGAPKLHENGVTQILTRDITAVGEVLFHGTKPPSLELIEDQAAEQTTLF